MPFSQDKPQEGSATLKPEGPPSTASVKVEGSRLGSPLPAEADPASSSAAAVPGSDIYTEFFASFDSKTITFACPLCHEDQIRHEDPSRFGIHVLKSHPKENYMEFLRVFEAEPRTFVCRFCPEGQILDAGLPQFETHVREFHQQVLAFSQDEQHYIIFRAFISAKPPAQVEEDFPRIIKQPETRPISQEQLVAEVKGSKQKAAA